IDSAEVRSSKGVAEAELDHEGSKRQKTNEASGSVQEQPEEEEKKLSQEDLHQMIGNGYIKYGQKQGKKDKNPSTGMERARKTEAEGI
ncbi:hypothetical protein Tco_1510162, partial [Tanacetum coccineum]